MVLYRVLTVNICISLYVKREWEEKEEEVVEESLFFSNMSVCKWNLIHSVIIIKRFFIEQLRKKKNKDRSFNFLFWFSVRKVEIFSSFYLIPHLIILSRSYITIFNSFLQKLTVLLYLFCLLLFFLGNISQQFVGAFLIKAKT